jgi:hypothetical protein
MILPTACHYSRTIVEDISADSLLNTLSELNEVIDLCALYVLILNAPRFGAGSVSVCRQISLKSMNSDIYTTVKTRQITNILLNPFPPPLTILSEQGKTHMLTGFTHKLAFIIVDLELFAFYRMIHRGLLTRNAIC